MFGLLIANVRFYIEIVIYRDLSLYMYTVNNKETISTKSAYKNEKLFFITTI